MKLVKGYQPMDSFDEATADNYDANPRGNEASTVALLAELAGEGPALELAIGTGRIALPLAARGIRVDGVDLSPAMVTKLRAKPGGEHLSIRMGDFADVPVEGSYKLIFLVFNTLFNLLTQEHQVLCFENVAMAPTLPTSSPEVRGRTPTWKASTAASATSCSPEKSSTRSWKHGCCSTSGATPTIATPPHSSLGYLPPAVFAARFNNPELS